METFPTRFKALMEGPKRTIFASGGLGVLQMVSEPGSERCVSLLVGPKMGGFGGGPTSIRERDECERGRPRKGWIMMSHIS